MKLTIPKKQLVSTLEYLRPLFSKGSLPALEMVQLTADSSLKISGNNLDLYCEQIAGGEVSKPGSVAVSGFRLLNAAKFANGEQVEITATTKELSFRCGKMTATIPAISPDELSKQPEFKPESAGDIDGEMLSNALKLCAPFASRDGGRPILNGVCFHSDSEETHLIATEGHLMIRTNLPIKKMGVVAVIPNGAIGILCGLSGSVHLGFMDGRFSAESDTTKIIGSQVEGSYPQCQNYFTAKEFKTTVSMPRKDAESAIGFTTIGAPTNGRKIVRLHIGKGEVSALSHASEGEAQTSVPATVTGGALKMAYDSEYLSTLLAAFDQEEVTLNFVDEFEPVHIRTETTKALLMGLRIQ